MSDSVDRVFVHALNTVKKIPRMGSARPPPAQRLRLYGLYKQSMEGDVDGVMDRPVGDDDEIRSDQEKWDAWYQQRGLSRTEAKRKYITTLIDTMHRYASSTPYACQNPRAAGNNDTDTYSSDARELVAELEFVWDQIKFNPPSSSSSNSFPRPPGSQQSPNSTNDRVIYPVMSEHGARHPSQRRDDRPMRVLNPTSEPLEEDEAEPGINADQEDPDNEAREQFVDAPDSQVAGDDRPTPTESSHEEEQHPPRSRDKGGGAKGIIAPVVSYIKGVGMSAEDKWHKRIESALIKMNTEMAALREQLEMQQEAATTRSGILGSFSHPRKKRVGWAQWIAEIVWSGTVAVVRHICINALLLVAVSLFMKYRGIPLERLEHMASRWVRRLQHLAFVRRLGKMTEHQARSLGIRPAHVPSSRIKGPG